MMCEDRHQGGKTRAMKTMAETKVKEPKKKKSASLSPGSQAIRKENNQTKKKADDMA